MAKLNKKGIFFTLVSITLLILLVISLTGSHSIQSHNYDAIRAQFNILESHKRNLESYADNILYVQSKNALKDLVRYTYNDGTIDNATLRFEELLMNGTLYGETSNAPSMVENGIQNWTNRINDRALDFLQIKSNLSIANPKINQTFPFRVNISADVMIDTAKGNMSYSSKDTYHVSLSIQGLNDPLYYHNNLENTINRTTITNFNYSSTLEMVEKSTYRHTEYAPSFLNRLENKTISSECCGIESLVNADLFGITSSDQYNRSYVDYLFWSKNRSCQNIVRPIYNFTEISNEQAALGFKLDLDYMALYGMDDTDTHSTICD